MSWRSEISNSSQRELDALPDSVWREAVEAISDLAEDPFPSGSIALRGHQGLYRIRIYSGRYRIIYRVSGKQGRVIIKRVRPRASAYQGL